MKELFKPLQDLESDPDPELWAELSASLPVRTFMHWGPGHFNIFYLSGILAGALLLFVLFQPKPTQLRDISPINTDSVSVPFQQRDETDSANQTLPAREQSYQDIRHISNNTPNTSSETKIPDSSSSATNRPHQADTVKKVMDSAATGPVVKPKKVIRIIKRDTLHVKDSVGIKKRRWQKF
ncbi:MAG: hypothetical protein MUF42_09810 [Cytophagaceae bacterium]|nr:hypothetical protein [Cytophagaceae bacterium]